MSQRSSENEPVNIDPKPSSTRKEPVATGTEPLSRSRLDDPAPYYPRLNSITPKLDRALAAYRRRLIIGGIGSVVLLAIVDECSRGPRRR